jgi:putative endonuclease
VSVTRDSHELGRAAERAALKFLRSRGYKILARNFAVRAGEVDIIAADGDAVCFIEVRARSDRRHGPPFASVGRRKQARLRAAAEQYLTARRLRDRPCRFDVVSVVPDPGQRSGWDIELLQNAF